MLRVGVPTATRLGYLIPAGALPDAGTATW